MYELLTYIVVFVFGIVLIIKGADWVTRYAARLAKQMGVSEIVIGITLISIATSLPELSVSMFSALMQVDTIAVGTVVGSNITNIALEIGLAALIAPIVLGKHHLKQLYALVAFTVVSAIFLIDGLMWYEGLTIIAGFVAYMYYILRMKTPLLAPKEVPFEEEDHGKKKKFKNLLLSLFGVFVIVLGAHLLIDSTIFIANMMNISELIISIIVIAIGTSLPEIATVVAAAIKRMEGIAIGAAVGSNIFNLTALALASLATPIHVTRSLVLFSIPLMILVSVLLLVTLRTGWKLKRREGILFLIVYAVFIYMQFIVW